jgi:hypothetical protein
VVRSQNRPCVLGIDDGLPVLHSSEPFGLVEAELHGINGWVDVVVYHAGSRSQPQIVLHSVAPSVSSRWSWPVPS